MNMMDPILQMLAYELAVIFMVLSLWLLYQNHKKNKEMLTHATKHVSMLAVAKEARIEELTLKITEKYGLTGKALSESASSYQDKEQQINKAIVTSFVTQSNKSLLSSSDQIKSIVDSCLDFLPIVEKVENETSEVIEEEDNSSLSLTEQIDAATLKLDLLMAELKETFGEDDVENSDDTELEASKPEEEVDAETIAEEVTSVDDVDATLAGVDVETEADNVEAVAEEEVTSVDDVDAILAGAAVETEADNVEAAVEEEVTSVDDVDATLAGAAVETEADNVEAAVEEEVTSVDDVDAILAGVDVETEADNVEAVAEEEVTSVDDVDAILAGVDVETEADNSEMEEAGEDMVSIDDVDAILAGVDNDITDESIDLSNIIDDEDEELLLKKA